MACLHGPRDALHRAQLKSRDPGPSAITLDPTASGVSAFISDNVGPVVVALASPFTVAFGVRPSAAERHQRNERFWLSPSESCRRLSLFVVGVYVTFVL